MKVLITGGTGFLGKHIWQQIQNTADAKSNEYIFLGSSDCYLESQDQVDRLFRKHDPDIVIHAAADVGGIGYNRLRNSILLEQNLQMGINVIQACMSYYIDRLIVIGSVCAYPGNAHIPITENQLWLGRPDESNAGYGIAKRTVMELASQCAGDEFEVVNLILANLYGPGDCYNPDRSHVVAALVVNIVDAIDDGLGDDDHPDVTIWGDGSPTRDLLYVGDAANAIVKAIHMPLKENPLTINIATGMDHSISEIAKQIARIAGFKGKFVYDKSKPNGQLVRKYSTYKARWAMDWMFSTSLSTGLEACVKDYRELRARRLSQSVARENVSQG